MFRIAAVFIALCSAMALAQAIGVDTQDKDAPKFREKFEQAQNWIEKGKGGEALALLESLAANGYAPAEAQLGVLYLQGDVVPENAAIAAIWFYRAAQKGLASAQLAFGSLYIEGRGVEQDHIEAYKWLNLVAKRSEGPIAQRAKDLLYDIAKNMSENDIMDAERRFRKWRPVQPLSQNVSGY